MIAVTLPLRLLSEANERGHWSKGAKRAKEQRAATLWAVRARIVPSRGGWAVMPDWRRFSGPLAVTLTRIAPRKLDGDNLQRACKAVRDGVADALGVDDGDERIEWRYEQRPARDGEGQRFVTPGKDMMYRYGVEIRVEARETVRPGW